MNSVNIIGNITRDVELKYAQNGTAIASIGVAVNKQVKNAQGGYDSKPVFIDVTAFGKTAETLNQYFRKGSKIGIDGELNFEQWQDQNGQKRSKLSVIMNRLHFIDKKEDAQGGGQPQQQYGQPQQPTYQPQGQPQYGQPQQNSQAPAQAGQPQYNQPQQGQQPYQQLAQQQYSPQGQQDPQKQAQPQQSYQPQGQAPNPQMQGQPNQNRPQQGQPQGYNGQPARQQQINEDQIPF